MSWKLKVKTKEKLTKEIGTYYKEQADISVALVFPNTYFVGMSNLGFQTIYQLLNKRKDTVCERAFLPNKDELNEFKRTNTQLWTLEHQKSLLTFDIIGFSVSFEMDYFHVLDILTLANIPIKKQLRNELHPLIIAGGTAVTSNPKPLVEFIDAFIMGEGEEVINKVIEICIENKGNSHKNLLLDLSKIQGIYVPDSNLSNSEHRISSPLIDLNPFPTHSCIITPDTEFSQMFLIEVGRSCPRRCKFCLASHIYQPYRYRGLECLMTQVQEGLKMTSRIGLIGSALSDYPYLIKLCQEIKASGGKVSLSSLRVDKLNEDIISIINQQSITLGLEAGSFRLRKVIGKGFSDEEIFDKIEMLNSTLSATLLKLYFMIGLPTEEQVDIQALCELTKKIKSIFRGKLTLGISPFVPKPHTPFQNEVMDKESILKKKIAYIKQELKGIKITGEGIKSSIIQWELSTGSRDYLL